MTEIKYGPSKFECLVIGSILGATAMAVGLLFTKPSALQRSNYKQLREETKPQSVYVWDVNDDQVDDIIVKKGAGNLDVFFRPKRK
jgi:hypothetical protein